MTVKELYKQITKEMSAEQALMKLLEAHVINYEKLKFNEGEEIHPTILISMAALELGWEIALPYRDNDEVIGMTIGTEEYFNSVFGESYIDDSCGSDDCCGNGGCAGCGDYLDNIGGNGDYTDNIGSSNDNTEQLNYE